MARSPDSSLLALRTKMRSPPAEYDSLDRRLTDQAGQPGTQVHVVLELEEAFASLGIHVVGNRRSSRPNRLLQHFLQRCTQTLKLHALKPPCLPQRMNTGPEQRFI